MPDELDVTPDLDSSTKSEETPKVAKSYLDVVSEAASASPADDLGTEDSDQDTPDEGDGEKPASADTDEAAAGKQAEKAKTPTSEAPAEEPPPPFHKHPRWQKVLKERDEARQRADTVEERLTQLEDSATRMQNLESYVREANLDVEEFNAGLEIMRLMKSDPQAAYQALLPYMQSLEQATGASLPEDLQTAVDEGEVSSSWAMAEAKRRAETNQTQSQTRAQLEAQRRQAEQASHSALSGWLKEWQEADRVRAERAKPLFEARFIRALEEWRGQTRRNLPNPSEVVSIAKQVRGELDSLMPATPVTPKGRRGALPDTGVRGEARPEPKSVLDLINQATGV